jgi:MFS family permease
VVRDAVFCYPPAVIADSTPKIRVPRPLAAYLQRTFPTLSLRRREGLRWYFMDAALSQVSGSFYEDFFVLFALATGFAATSIGLLAAAGSLASVLAYLPGAFLTARLRTRKPLIMITSGGIARLSIFALAFLPAATTGGATVLLAIAGSRFLTALMGSVATPAGTTLAGDLAPGEIRGRYFALRNAAITIVGACASALAGWLVRFLNQGSPDGLVGYRVAFCVAFAFGMLATACFSRIPEPPAHRGPRLSRRLRDVADIIRRKPAFGWFAASSALWGLAVNASAPFFNVYLVTRLGGNAAVVGIGSAIMALSGLAGLAVFGRLADRRGAWTVVAVTGLAISVNPALWAFVRVPWHTYLVNVPGGFFWAGYNLASFNLLLEMSPPEDRESGVALFQTLVAVSAVAGPLLGGWAVSAMGFVPLFLLSGALRLVATGVLILRTRPRR